MSGRWLAAGCIGLALAFGALGVWQLERLEWKLALIDRVNMRTRAPPRAIPPRPAWNAISVDADEYRHVTVTGELLNDKETLVQAVTELGPGFWVMTPLRTNDATILINRGFVPPEKREPASRSSASPTGFVTVTGLLRTTEPQGGFLHANNGAENRWYSRDVAAIGQARKLSDLAPFFIDADATPNPGGYPVGGLTVVRFRNAHLAYALTWFALAALSVFGAAVIVRSSRRAGAPNPRD